jgi:hypothetical protein
MCKGRIKWLTVSRAAIFINHKPRLDLAQLRVNAASDLDVAPTDVRLPEKPAAVVGLLQLQTRSSATGATGFVAL